jgi:hypothetical protein
MAIKVPSKGGLILPDSVKSMTRAEFETFLATPYNIDNLNVTDDNILVLKEITIKPSKLALSHFDKIMNDADRDSVISAMQPKLRYVVLKAGEDAGSIKAGDEPLIDFSNTLSIKGFALRDYNVNLINITANLFRLPHAVLNMVIADDKDIIVNEFIMIRRHNVIAFYR